MNKVMRLGAVECDGRPADLYARATYKDGRLSIVGVIGPKSNGDARGGCGQIDPARETFTSYAPGWDAETVAEFSRLWERWHLNDIRAGCEHQRASWDVTEQLDLVPLTWGDLFHQRMQAAEAGTMDPAIYETWSDTVRRVHALTITMDAPKHPDAWGAEGEELIAARLVRVDKAKRTTKAAGWVYPEEHPRGLLCKPCETCGYKYGMAWMREEVPAEVLAWIESRPDADKAPAWV